MENNIIMYYSKSLIYHRKRWILMSPINILDLNLSYFKTFIVLAETGTYTEAAQKLNIAQSAISQKVQSLEKEFGIKLIQRARGRQKFKLTAAGEEFYLRCQSLCKQAENFAEEMRILRAGSAGILRISVSASRSQELVENILVPFHAVYPQIDFDIKEDTLPKLEENIQNDLTEIAISNTPLRNPQDFEILHSSKEKVYAVLAKGTDIIATDKKIATLKDLSNVPISLSKGSSILFLTIMSQAGYNPHILANNSSRRMALSWAKKRLAVAIIPMDDLAPRDENLRYLPIADEHFFTEKIIYKLAKKPLSSITKKFLDFYLAQLQQTPKA